MQLDTTSPLANLLGALLHPCGAEYCQIRLNMGVDMIGRHLLAQLRLVYLCGIELARTAAQAG
jgi:hypothetical protein